MKSDTKTRPMGSAIPTLPSKQTTRPIGELFVAPVASQAAPPRFAPPRETSKPVPLVRRREGAFSEAVTRPLPRDRQVAPEARAAFARLTDITPKPEFGTAVAVVQAPPPADEMNAPVATPSRVVPVLVVTTLLGSAVLLLALTLHAVLPAVP